MRTQELIVNLQNKRNSMSLTKASVQSLMHANGKTPSKAVLEHFDKAIDNMADMEVFIYSKMKFKHKVAKHSETPLHTNIEPSKGNPDSVLSALLGKVNFVVTVLEKFDGKENHHYTNIIDHKTMTKVKLTPKYFTHLKNVLESCASIQRSLKGIKFA